jgi:exosortase/archaeosortase family protein
MQFPLNPWRLLMSVAIIGASLVLALAVYFGFIAGGPVQWIGEWTASSTSSVLNLLGASTTADGTILYSSGFAADIVVECTAVGPLLLFMGAVAAFPSTVKAKGLGLLLGAVTLTAVNLVRIVSLFWIGESYPQYLDVAHLLVWQTAMIVVAIILWLAWVDRVAGARAL